MHKMIIVDDEQSIKRSLKNIIDTETSTFEVVGFADDGREALSLIERFSPEVVVTDIRMPVMDGLTLAQEIRERDIAAEIVMISGYSDFTYAKQALKYGVADYLLKPIDIDEVTKVLQRIDEKLSQSKRSILERSEWISLCKTTAEKLAKHMWVLNETEVWRTFENINHQAADAQFKTAQLKEIALHLMSLLNAEISGLSGDRIRLAILPESVGTSEELLGENVSALFRQIMDEIRQLRNWGSQRSVAEAIKHIEHEYTNEAFALKDAADLAGMSTTYFSKSFKEEMGMSFTQYVAKLRMDKAIELLSDSSNRVYEVAYAIGYSEYAHFAKVFKKYFGFSPTEYRNHLETGTHRAGPADNA